MKKLIFSLLFIVFISTNIHSQIYQQWFRTFLADGSYSRFINIDLSGNAYIVGSYTPRDGPTATFHQKFGPTGTQIYSNFVDTPCGPVGVFLDSLNNEYISGYYQGGWAPARTSIMKYNPAGVLLWRHLDSMSNNDRIIDMAGENNGNSYVVLFKNGVQQIIKYNSLGIQQLLFNITDTITTSRIHIDNQNNILITGYAYLNPNNSSTIITIKYSSAGIRQWKSVYVPPGGYNSSSGAELRTGITGNVYVMTTTSNQANTRDYTVIKYNSTGAQQWISFYNRFQFDDAYSMVIDNLENTYVTGSSGTVKFNFSGTLLWADTIGLVSLAIDKNYNVYGTGSKVINNHPGILTIKLSNTGMLLWSITYSTGSPFSDYSNAIALDTSGNVFITGQVAHTPLQGYQGSAATIKYSSLEGIRAISNEIPKAFSLSQNYPNPFNPATKIKFDIPPVRATRRVALTIFDVLGREVATLVNESLKPGSYEVEWDGSQFASGVYFYKLDAGNFTETKKMVLIK